MENTYQPDSRTKRQKTGGRTQGTLNKATAEVKELAREHGPEAIERLAYLMKHAKAEQAQVAAAKELDRGYGKSTQQMEVNNTRYVVRAPLPAPDVETWLAKYAPKADRTIQ